MKTLFLTLFLVCITSVYAQQKFININGTSELILNADQINFSVQIKVIKETLAESKKTNDDYVNRLLQLLKSSGIGSDDIEVSPVTLGKNYEYSGRERVQKGYFTLVNVSFILKDLSKYYDLTDRLTRNDNFEVTNSYYTLSDYEQQNKIAYQNALKAAKDKAEYMCNTLGLTLGDVLEIDETGNAPVYPLAFNTRTKENSGIENPFGNVTIRRSIRVKFSLK